MSVVTYGKGASLITNRYSRRHTSRAGEARCWWGKAGLMPIIVRSMFMHQSPIPQRRIGLSGRSYASSGYSRWIHGQVGIMGR